MGVLGLLLGILGLRKLLLGLLLSGLAASPACGDVRAARILGRLVFRPPGPPENAALDGALAKINDHPTLAVDSRAVGAHDPCRGMMVAVNAKRGRQATPRAIDAYDELVWHGFILSLTR